VAPMVKPLSSRHEALSLNPSIIKKEWGSWNIASVVECLPRNGSWGNEGSMNYMWCYLPPLHPPTLGNWTQDLADAR
jgi:hypothetical protein